MLCIQKPIRADDFVSAQKKREILTGGFAALLIVCAVAARVITRGHRDAVYFLPVSLLRSFIYIGLTTWWGVSLWQRIVQAQVRRYLAATAALCVFWLSIRTVKFFFAATPAAIRYLWYKNKKQIDNDRENWVVFQDVHEAIIERAVYEQVQQKRGKIRKRRTNNGEHNMFSGLLVCADCGSNLHFHFNAVWDHTEKLREQYAAELKKVTQLQKQWALRKTVLDAHCLTLQKEILRLEQEVDALVMEKLNGDGGSSAHEIGT